MPTEGQTRCFTYIISLIPTAVTQSLHYYHYSKDKDKQLPRATQLVSCRAKAWIQVSVSEAFSFPPVRRSNECMKLYQSMTWSSQHFITDGDPEIMAPREDATSSYYGRM